MKRFDRQYLGEFVNLKTVAVVAGSKREFDHFHCGHRDAADRFIYIHDEISLRGLRDAEVVFYGTFYERKDLAIIEAIVRSKRAAGDLR